MDKDRFSQGAHAGALSTHNRSLFFARSFLLLLFLALSVMSLQPKTSAKAAERPLPEKKTSLRSQQLRSAAPNCSACEQALVQCLASGGGGSCYDRYDACTENCSLNQ